MVRNRIAGIWRDFCFWAKLSKYRIPHQVLLSASTIAMDAEWVPETKGVAILQLATWEEVHIWDLQESVV